MGNAVKNNLLKKTRVQSPASAEKIVVVCDKSPDTAAPISTTRHGETSGGSSTTTDTPAETNAADPIDFTVETSTGSVNSEREVETNEEPGEVTEDDEDKVNESNPSEVESSAGSEGAFYSGQSEKEDDNEEEAEPEIEPEIEPEAEPEIEPESEPEAEAEVEKVSEENLLKLLTDQVKRTESPTVRDIKNTKDSRTKVVVVTPKRVTRKASLLKKLARQKEEEPVTAPETTDRDQGGGAKDKAPVRRSL